MTSPMRPKNKNVLLKVVILGSLTAQFYAVLFSLISRTNYLWKFFRFSFVLCVQVMEALVSSSFSGTNQFDFNYIAFR